MGTKLHCQQQLQWNTISGWEDEKSKTRRTMICKQWFHRTIGYTLEVQLIEFD